MKLQIESRQDYGTHVEEYKEEFPCEIEEKEQKIIITFEQGKITIEENRIIQERGENKIVIEPNQMFECDYETEYGMFVLDIYGMEVEKREITDSFLARAKYEIRMVGVETYYNEIILRIVCNDEN